MGGRARPSSLNIFGENEDNGCSCDKQRNNGNNCVCGEKHSLRPLQTPVGKSGLRLPHPHHCGERCRFVALDIFDVRDFGHSYLNPLLSSTGLTRLLVDGPYKNLVVGTQCGLLRSLTQARIRVQSPISVILGLGMVDAPHSGSGAGGQRSVAARNWSQPINGWMGLRPGYPLLQDFGQSTPPYPHGVTWEPHAYRLPSIIKRWPLDPLYSSS